MLTSWSTSYSRLSRRIETTLFPPRSSVRFRLGRAERFGLLLGLLILAIVLQLFRAGPSEALDSLWAEDGQIFLQGAISGSGILHSVFETYAGYLVFVPRLIGEAAGMVPLREAAATTALLSGAVVATSGLAVWYGSSALIRNPYMRGTLVALTILCPVANLESVASGAYVPWYMLFAAFWLLFWRPETTWGAMIAGLFLLATGLSSPGVWFFAPVAVLRLLVARDRRDWIILSGFATGAAVQVPVMALNTEPSVGPVWTHDIWTAYLQRVFDGAIFGERLGGVAWEHLGWAFLIFLLTCTLVGLAMGLRSSAAPGRWLAVVAISTSLAMFVVSAYQRAVATPMKWPPGLWFGAGGRYAIVPALLLISAAMALVDWSAPRRVDRFAWAPLVTVSVLLVGLVISFDVREPAGRGKPPWGQALHEGAALCRTEGMSTVRIPISPPGFGVTVPCDSLP